MNTDSDTYERVVDLLVDHLDINKQEATPDADLIADLGADDLDLIEIVMLVEDEFDIIIPDDIAEKINTVGDIVDQIHNIKRI